MSEITGLFFVKSRDEVVAELNRRADVAQSSWGKLEPPPESKVYVARLRDWASHVGRNPEFMQYRFTPREWEELGE